MTDQITPFPAEKTEQQREAAEIVRRTVESLYEIFPFFKHPYFFRTELREREDLAPAMPEKTNEAA
jgi:hypothetical protein